MRFDVFDVVDAAESLARVAIQQTDNQRLAVFGQEWRESQNAVLNLVVHLIHVLTVERS